MKKWIIILSILFIIGVPLYDFLNVELDELSEGKFLSEHP
jgi:hypothetical protein